MSAFPTFGTPLHAASADPADSDVIVIGGAGRAFSTGVDQAPMKDRIADRRS